MTLVTPQPDRTRIHWRGWKLYWGLYRGLRRHFILGGLLSILQAVVLLPIPPVLAILINDAVKGEDMKKVASYGALMICLSLTGALLNLTARYLLLKVNKRVAATLQNRLVEHLAALPASYHDSQDQGQLHAIVVHETSRLDLAVATLMSDGIPAIAGIFGFTAVLLHLNPLLFAITILGYCPVIIATRILSKVFRKYHDEFRIAFRAFSAGVTRSLRLMPLMRQAGLQDEDVRTRAAEIDALRRNRILMGWFSSANAAGHNNALRIGLLVVLLAGCWMMIKGSMTGGDLVAFCGGMALLNGQVQALLNSVPTVVGADNTLISITEVLDQDATPLYSGARRIELDGRISLHDVKFHYEESRPVLRGVDLEVPPGCFVALLGPSGSGKTTMLSIILGICKPTEGSISLSGVPMADLDLPHARRQIGVVSQDLLLLNGTIEENIRLEKPSATEEDIREAAHKAHLDDFISSLPDGYKTQVGESGVKLSGGQRQRLSIARAMVRKPRLLLLDEPTHGLDPAAAREVMKTLHSLHNTCSIVLVTHDLELVRKADLVCLLEEGLIVERGRMEELEQRSEAYRRLRGLSRDSITLDV